MKQRPAGRPSSSEKVIRDIKRKTRKQYGGEEKTRIVLDGLRGEDCLPFMSLRKLPTYATSGFNMNLLGLSLLIFAGVVLRRFYQRANIREFHTADKTALNAVLWTSIAHLLAVVLGLIVLAIVQDDILMGIPGLRKAWLLIPIIATLLTLYLVYRTIGVWKENLLGGLWPRIRYTAVILVALFMCWFYFFWSILGYQYK